MRYRRAVDMGCAVVTDACVELQVLLDEVIAREGREAAAAAKEAKRQAQRDRLRKKRGGGAKK